MTPHDMPEFTELLDSTCALLTRGQYRPNETSTVIFFRALAEFDMATVRAAFGAHVRGSKFAPTPADIREAIEGAAAGDGRLGPEEAWALALTARDEADTVVWTGEIAEAWNVARVVYMQGDEVGARMAFKEAYTRAVATARAERRPLAWQITEGHDPARRAEAVKIAAEKGRIARNTGEFLALAAPQPTEPTELLTGPPDDTAARALQALAGLKDRMAMQPDYVPSAGAVAVLQTRERQAAVAQQVEAYAGGRA